jgi:tetratricopeptide (TPR) repeat protein
MSANTGATGLLCLSAVFFTGWCAAALGDDVVTGERNLAGVRILGLSNGQLSYRLPDGTIESSWLDEIELLQVDRGGVFADFNQAERMMAEGRPEQAISRFRRSLRLTEGFWAEVVPVRLLIAADRAGEIDTAAAQFVRVVRGRGSGPRAAVRLFLRNVPDRRSGKVADALDVLTKALAGGVDDTLAVPLLLQRFRILHHIAAAESERQRTSQSEKRGRGSAPAAIELAEQVAAMTIPEILRVPEVYQEVWLALDVLFAIDGDAPVAWDGLDRAIRDCPDEWLPSFLLLKGRVLQQSAETHEDWIRASWPFLRVALHFPDDPRAADGYYGAAIALERIGRVDHAMAALRQAMAIAPSHSPLGAEVRAMLERLEARDSGTPSESETKESD